MDSHRKKLFASMFLVMTLSYSGVAWAVLQCPYIGGCEETSSQHHSDATHHRSPAFHCADSYYNIETFATALTESRSPESPKLVQLKSFFMASSLRVERLFWIRPFLEQLNSLSFLNSPPLYVHLSVFRI